jgi:hypothetical protein
MYGIDVSTALVSTERIDKALDYLSDLPHVTNWYSGRGMFGAYCFGFTLDGGDSDLITFFLDLARDEDGRELAQTLRDVMRQDALGYRTIYYFPGFRLDTKSRYRDPDDDDLEAFDQEDREYDARKAAEAAQ